jgi:hypothetical protein
MNTILERKTKVISEKTNEFANSAPPEPLYPFRGQLTKLLAEHAAIVAGLDEFESRLQRSQLDLNEAISKDDDVEIARFQGMESVFNLKVSAKRATLTKLLAQLPSAISSTSNEYSTLLLAERTRRVDALTERVSEVLGADARRMSEGHYLDDVLDESGAVKAIDQLRLNFNLIGASDEAVLSSAKTLLDCYDEILRAAKETI